LQETNHFVHSNTRSYAHSNLKHYTQSILLEVYWELSPGKK